MRIQTNPGNPKETIRGIHSHECGKCGRVWSHNPPKREDSDQDILQSHTCCGQLWWLLRYRWYADNRPKGIPMIEETAYE